MSEPKPKPKPAERPRQSGSDEVRPLSAARGTAAAAANPFSTRHTRPGSLSYFFPAGDTLEVLLSRLESQGGWGEIVGPHGSGKSTLLAMLVASLAQAGRRPIVIALHDHERALPLNLNQRADLDESTLIVVDGYEQLSRWNRLRLKKLCQRGGWGLVVTSHATVGLPHLYETSVSMELARQLVKQLLATGDVKISDYVVTRCYERSGGNLREMLFELYDLYERAKPRV